MQYNNVELAVQIKGKPITEYPHNGQVFVEGRDGSNFEVVVKNHNAFTVEAVISVDGLSVLDGKDAGPASSGYVLKAGETIAIPGWKLDGAQVAAFQFAGKANSYAQQSTGTARNTGVIGLLVYRERTMSPIFRSPMTFCAAGPNLGVYNAVPNAVPKGIMRGMGPTETYSATSDSLSSLTASQAMASHDNVFIGSMVAGAMPQNATATVAAMPMAAPPVVEQQLGTGFGEATDFATTEVQFLRGDMVAMIVLYYDNARALKARGIDLSRRAQTQRTQTPNAFPGMSGCVPPPGWTR